MVDFKNYTLNNATSVSGVFEHTADVFQTATGYDMFGPFLLIIIWAGFLSVGMKLNIENAFPYSMFMTMVAAVIMGSAGIITMEWVALSSVLAIGSIVMLKSG